MVKLSKMVMNFSIVQKFLKIQKEMESFISIESQKGYKEIMKYKWEKVKMIQE